MPKNSSKYVGDCSVKGIANKFRQLGYMKIYLILFQQETRLQINILQNTRAKLLVQ